VHLLHASAMKQRGVPEQFRRFDVSKSDLGEIVALVVNMKFHSIHV
jgi:hypothetical protein